jgi:hypothetical protein
MCTDFLLKLGDDASKIFEVRVEGVLPTEGRQNLVKKQDDLENKKARNQE